MGGPVKQYSQSGPQRPSVAKNEDKFVFPELPKQIFFKISSDINNGGRIEIFFNTEMTFEGLGEMFEGYSADTGAGKFQLVPMGGQAEGLAWADLGAMTPIGASGNFHYFSLLDLGRSYHRY